MTDPDKILYFTCPEQCGQLAAACSLRMILDKQPFFCESCGCEFRGADRPEWLKTATHLGDSPEDRKLHAAMTGLYSYLYAGGPCPDRDFVSELLLRAPEYWRAFPGTHFSDAVILRLIASDGSFAAGFDFSSLPCGSWPELLSERPQLASRCPWSALSRYLSAHPEVPEKLSAQAELIFQHSGLDKDIRFSPNGSGRTCEIDHFWFFVTKFHWAKHVNWEAFPRAEIFAAFRGFPELLTAYPFSEKNIESFDWQRFGVWEEAAGFLRGNTLIAKLGALFTGTRAAKTLKEHPSWEKYCAWDKLSAEEWLQILQDAPQYAARCNWRRFEAQDWLAVFRIDPDYAGKCDWTVFSSADWTKVLKEHPRFADHCPWKRILPAHWKRILKDDQKNGGADFEGKFRCGTLKFEDFRHPCYWAVYCLTQAKNIGEALERFPALEAEYLNWDAVGASELLELLARAPREAAKLTGEHWRKIAAYVNTLGSAERQSVKNVHEKCWEMRGEILENASLEKIAGLGGDDFYTLIDFMDWEGAPAFDWRGLNKSDILKIAVNHPDVAEKYGWDKFSAEELTRLALQSPAFLDKYASLLTHGQLARVLEEKPEMYPRVKAYFSLTLSELVHFRYYGQAQLLKKVAWYRLFVTQAAVFVLGWFFLLFGDCGYWAFAAEHPAEAKHAFWVYVGFALIWSCIHAFLYQYHGKGAMCRFLGITAGAAGVMFYGGTFFLACFDRKGYWIAAALYALYMLLLFRSRGKRAARSARMEIPGSWKMFFKGLSTVLIQAAVLIGIAVSFLPSTSDECLALAKQLGAAKTSFRSAERFFYREAKRRDEALRKDLAAVDSLVRGNDYARAEETARRICAKYPDRTDLIEKIQKEQAVFVREQTAEAKKHFAEKNYGEALKFLEKADQTDADVLYMLGFIYADGSRRGDPAEAVRYLSRAAERGHAAAQDRLGECFLRGQGVKKDPAAAVEWFRRSAAQGNADAQCNLGVCYFRGQGVEKDLSAAAAWFRKSAAQGNAEAQNRLGFCYYTGQGAEKDLAAAVEWFRQSAEQGNAEAQNNLGRCCYFGQGVKKNLAAAAGWFRRAAAQGHAAAQCNLGECYANGWGVGQNMAAAVNWYRQSAAQGHAAAQNNLARCYYLGQGVEKDPAAAVEWYRRSAEQGYAAAQCVFGLFYLAGLNVEKDPAAAVVWFRKAAKQDYAAAQYCLGFCCFRGLGVKKDLTAAAGWFRKSAEQGYADAQEALGECYANGWGVERDRAEAEKWHRKAKAQKR